MRKGPHPLLVHLGMAAINMKGIQEYASSFSGALTQTDAVNMVRGMKMYQAHEFIAEEMPVDVIWQEGGMSVKSPVMLQAITPSENSVPLLIVPSLINKANILDISEEQSMLRWFNQHGIDTYMLDWGDLKCPQEKSINIEALIQDMLPKAIQAVSKKTGKKVDVVGYCMGGVLLLAGYHYAQDHIRRMVLLASPWDFHTGSSPLARNVRIWSPMVLPVVRDRGCLPAEWVQALFASLDTKGSAQKFIRFASMDQSSSEAELFVSVEDWLNDGVDLPANIAQHCIQDWFVKNDLASGTWFVAGRNVDLSKINTQILIIASKNDMLVPYDCALSVECSLSIADVDVISPTCGHIGLIVGRHAKKSVWQPMLDWLKNNN
ncbi:MAG: hypothetical protein COA45_03375 [Zetaproteobacteria bacterium]|nr:MAG: hypothetical protein COA45_03375 [Zetaproteobacteria bacterium]